MTKIQDQPRNSSSIKHIFVRILKGLGILLAGVILIILIVGLFPVSLDELQPRPNPAASYEEAVARYSELEWAENDIVHEHGHSYLLTHGEKTPRVYVLVHGITNSPIQWLEFGEMMYQQGHNVLILRMPRHGLKSRSIDELKHLTPDELRMYSDQIIDIATGLGEEVYVAGISGGGTVASWVSQNRAEVDRTFMLSPFLGVGEIPDFVSTLLMNAFFRLPSIDIFSPTENIRDYAYAGETTRGISVFLMLGRSVRATVLDTDTPPHGKIFIQTTAVDTAANNDSTEILYKVWLAAGADVTMDQFDASLLVPHNSVDPAADPQNTQRVYDHMLKFFEEQIPTGTTSLQPD